MKKFKPWLVFSILLITACAAGWGTGRSRSPSLSVSGSPEGGELPADPGVVEEKALERNSIPAFDAASISSAILEISELMDSRNSPNVMLVMRLMAKVAVRMADLTPEQEAVILQGLPEEQRAGLGMAMKYFGMLLSSNSASAAQFQKVIQDPEAGDMITGCLLAFVSNDPAAALRCWQEEVAKENPAAWTRESAAMLFSQLSARDPRVAYAGAMAISDEKLREAAFANLSLHHLYSPEKSEWAADGDSLLKHQIAAAPKAQERALFTVLTARLKHETPEEALTWIDSLQLGPESQPWMNHALADAWKLQDPVKAATWLADRAAPEAKADVMENIVRDWTLGNLRPEERARRPEPDIAACADWILSRGPGPATEKAISRLADAWIDVGEPAAAIAWAQAIENEDGRRDTLNNITTQIQRRYPDSWQAMLKQAGLATGE